MQHQEFVYGNCISVLTYGYLKLSSVTNFN